MTDWGKHLFEAMDADGSGKVSFPEFYIGLWNYLAADLMYLQIMAFDMADEDKGVFFLLWCFQLLLQLSTFIS